MSVESVKSSEFHFRDKNFQGNQGFKNYLKT